MVLADKANKFIEDAKPWELRKQENQQQKLQDICTVALNLFRQIIIYLSPVLPQLKEQTEELLNQKLTHWDDAQQPLLGTSVNKFKHMMKRIEEKQVQAMIDESKEGAPSEEATPQSKFNDSGKALEKEPLAEECNFDDFMKVDLRVVRIIEAKEVEESNKLLQLTVSLGGGVTKNVFAGMKGVYKPEEMVGRLVIFCANLAPRKMRFGVSEGMVLAAGAGGKEIYLLTPDENAVPGQRVH